MRNDALLTLVIATDGTVEIEPGASFDESHLSLMTRAHEAVHTALANEPV